MAIQLIMHTSGADTKQSKLTELKQDFWSLWNLKSLNGQQIWHFNAVDSGDQFYQKLSEAFEFDSRSNPNSADLVLRLQKQRQKTKNGFNSLGINGISNSSLDYPNSLSRNAALAAHKNIRALRVYQEEDGHWAGDYGGPLFLLPSLVIASYLTDQPFHEAKKTLMIRYMLNHQNEDGGWGMHIEAESMMFCTVLQYCALRIFGLTEGDRRLTNARNWILSHGGATKTPSWGKFFLAILGVYEWKGCNSLMPEMWLLPRWMKVHPGRYWCHARMVYLPMSYCFGNKISKDPTPLTESLKKEIYAEDYTSINWSKATNEVADTDVFKKPSKVLKSLLALLNQYERFPIPALRKQALRFALDYIDAEDEQTKYIDIGPVNQIINSICTWHAYGPDSEQFLNHVKRWDDYLWLAEDGMKMNGYNGSQLWDTSFIMQALYENDLTEEASDCMRSAYSFIDYTQIKTEVKNREKFFRHPSVGGWPFSTLDHGWPIADCTAEGLKASLKLHRRGIGSEKQEVQRISDDRLKKSADLILTWQNKDGGWATYENYRSGSWLELLNPSEVFGEIMIDYSWVECTSACITALIEFQKDYPNYRSTEIRKSIVSGLNFIKSRQNEDGSWIGSWGICFTYGTWFGMEALANGSSYLDSSEEIKKACQFLISKQNEDGGWGESYLSCVESTYVNNSNSQVVNTGWALLALMAGGCSNKRNIDAGIDFLIKSQQEDGEWPQQSISGVFNKTCMITYSAYRNIFPLWALGRYTHSYSRKLRHNVENQEA